MMKNILCFGDSNTYGSNPLDEEARLPINIRWTGVLQNILGKDYRIIEEGLGGRTVAMEDTIGVSKNGKAQIMTCLYSHAPIDLAIIMLGTNDMKHRFSLTARDISLAMNDLIANVLNIKQKDCTMKIMLVAPVAISDETTSGETFGSKNEMSRKLTPLYREIAIKHGIEFFTLLDLVEPSKADGIHLDPESHGIVGVEMAKKIKEILN